MSWDEEERRVEEIPGVKEGKALHNASGQTLRKHHAYLKSNLEFPFTAKVEDLDGVATIHSLFALKECPEMTVYELFVRGDHGRRLIEMPIAEIDEVPSKEKNNQLIEDYCFWLWNHR